MLEQLEIRNFKCFELLKLPLAPLTLLSGTNASGKSSVLQALVLLHQTMRDDEYSTRLLLNGSMVQLGTLADVVSLEGRGSFSIALEAPGESYDWAFAGERNDMSLVVDSVRTMGEAVHQPDQLRQLMPFERGDSGNHFVLQSILNLTYLTAEREGPRELYPIEDQHSKNRVGPRGENAVSILYSGRDELVADALRIENTPLTLLRQVEAQLNRFFPGCSLDVQRVSNVNAVTLGIRVSDATNFLRPIHCGFGITQVLPIIVAALAYQLTDHQPDRSSPITRGGMLLVENPEVHLHPAGQALMGRFLAEAANAGVQVIVETHSDHVLNGIRRAVKSNEIPAESVAIHFFRRPSADVPQVLSPTLDSSGNIDAWPDGFFDQFDRDMDYFAGWGE